MAEWKSSVFLSLFHLWIKIPVNVYLKLVCESHFMHLCFFFVQNVSSWEMVVFLNSFHSVEALQANLDFDFNLIWLQNDGWPEVLTVESDWGTRCQQGSSCSYLLVHANVEGSWSVDVKVLLYRRAQMKVTVSPSKNQVRGKKGQTSAKKCL